MPELPEVETVAESLAPKVRGKLCTHLEIYDSKLGKAPPKFQNLKIIEVSRLGKEILIHFKSYESAQEFYLLIHLRMSGRLLFQDKSLSKDQLADTEKYLKHKVIRINSKNFTKHIRATFFLKKSQIHFFDVRRFGTFKWSLEKPMLPLGVVDPVSSQLTSDSMKRLLDLSKNLALKTFLLRQDRIVGIGNIYASEILFDAGLSPFRQCNSLNPREIKNLTLSTRKILFAAIKHNGTTFSDFQLDDATTGNFQNFLKVYGKEKKPCPKCKSEIPKTTQNQRSTFYCRICQV